MKHLKKFENFYLNDENLEQNPDMDLEDDNRDEFQGLVDDEECEPCDSEEEEIEEPKNWGDESLEEKKSSKDVNSGLTAKQKKLPPALQKAILKRMKSKK